jgi:hypothetical protein
MNLRPFLLIAASTVSLFATAACGLVSDVHSYRYRLTVEVETPHGLRTGSSVIESRAWESNGLNGKMVQSELHGEAVAIDMPDGETLFALLDSGDGTAPFASAAFDRISPQSITQNPDWRVRDDAMARLTVAAEVPEKYYPIFVHFTDIKNPASVVAVDPAHLDVDFGDGVKLKRVFVKMTKDPVTTGIGRRFSWWEKFQESHFDGTPSRYEDMTNKIISAHMSSASFSTEYRK